MFCKFCGQPTENEAAVCDACAKAKEATRTVYTPKYGFQKALTAMLLGICGSVIGGIAVCGNAASMLSLFFGVFVAVGEAIAASEGGAVSVEENGELFGYLDVLGILNWIATAAVLTLGILALVLGIRSIRNFRDAKINGVKPKSTLTFGIIGTSCGGYAVFTGLVLFLFALAFI